jgi:hypothetical protein
MANLTDEELDTMVSAIDVELRRRCVPIFRRDMAAIVEFQKRTGIVEPIAGGLLRPGAPDTHARRIARWYRDHYGNRQNVDASPGATILVIRGEPWRCVFPRVFGTVQVDVRAQIQDLPPKLADSLTPKEVEDLVVVFGSRLDLFHRIEASQLKYLPEARKDLVYGVSDVCKSPPDLPMAKLFFSHAAEKGLKGFIHSKGKTPRHHHRLEEFAQQAEGLGLPAVPRALIEALFCPGGARYGDYKVDDQEAAILAHDAALSVIEQVLSATTTA